MTKTIELQTRFVVPDDMDEENIRHVVGQFFADLVRTDRFVDARIVEDEAMDAADTERLLDMLSAVDEDDLSEIESFVEDHTSE